MHTTVQPDSELGETPDRLTADTTPAPLKFHTPDGFRLALRRRVDQFFERSGKSRRDRPQMYIKTVLVLGWLAASYALLVFGPGNWWLVVPLTISLGLSAAAVGFNIQHDGGHGALSRHKWINKLASMTLDLLGGSSYIWARKHNSIHHSYTNVTGHDDDINLGFLGRLSPHDGRLKFHRLQHYYLWFLYGFLSIKWNFYDDFRSVTTRRIGAHRFPCPRGWDLVTFVGGKVVFFSLAFGLPMLLHPWWVVLCFYAAASFVQGVVLSLTFQLAHCVEEAEFPLPSPDTGQIEAAWAEHQVQTTVNFAPRNRLITWYVGGLNFQIEHHLFPQISHVHYPALAPLVRRTCREFGLRYAVHSTFLAAVASHFRWLRRMGRPAAAV